LEQQKEGVQGQSEEYKVHLTVKGWWRD